jgi:hypothetical protein
MSREMAKSLSGAIRAGMERIWRIETRCNGCYARAPGTGSGTARAPLDQGGRPEGEDVVVLDHDCEASGSWRRRSWRRGWGTAQPWRARIPYERAPLKAKEADAKALIDVTPINPFCALAG